MLQRQSVQKSEAVGRRPKRSILLVLFIVVLVAVTLIQTAYNYAQAAKTTQKIEEVSAQVEKVRTENEKQEYFLKKENHDAYFEKIAREEYGYAKPGERVVYDSSFGN